MKKTIVLIATILITGMTATAQVAINNTNTPPAASAMLDVQSTTMGFLAPRLTTA